jgi:digeranylgeranylglycerophospholipid reductase
VVGGEPASGPIERTVANGLMLVGDAARQVDPLTGGGIANAMDAGSIAGDVALNRSLAVKDRFVSLTDDDLNKLAHSVEGLDFATMDLFGLLVALIRKNPKTLWSLRKMFV